MQIANYFSDSLFGTIMAGQNQDLRSIQDTLIVRSTLVALFSNASFQMYPQIVCQDWSAKSYWLHLNDFSWMNVPSNRPSNSEQMQCHIGGTYLIFVICGVMGLLMTEIHLLRWQHKHHDCFRHQHDHFHHLYQRTTPSVCQRSPSWRVLVEVWATSWEHLTGAALVNMITITFIVSWSSTSWSSWSSWWRSWDPWTGQPQ